MRASRLPVVVAGLGLCGPGLVEGQLGPESLLAGVTDVSVFFTCWQTRGVLEQKGSCPSRQNGFGVEVSYNVGRLPWWRSPRTMARERRDTTGYEKRCGDAGCDSTLSITITKVPSAPTRYVFFELGLGYSQFAGFKSNDPALELRGTVREIPALSLYGTYRDEGHAVFKVLNPYIGVHSGLLQLSNVSLYDRVRDDTLSSFAASGTVFQLGAVAGVQLDVKERLRLYAELTNTNRRFPNLQWTSAGTNRVRDSYPRELDFSGGGVTLGVQLNVRPFKP